MTVSRKTFCARVVDVANAGVVEDRFFTYLSGKRGSHFFLHIFLSLCVFLLMRSIALYFIYHRSIFHLWGESLGEGNGGAGDVFLFRWKWSPLRTDLDQNSPWIFGGSNVFGVAWYCWSGREDQVLPMLLEIYCTLDRWPLTINLIVHLNLVRSVM